MHKTLVIQLARFGDLLQSKGLILSLEQNSNVSLCLDYSLVEIAKIIYPKAEIIPISAHNTSSSAIHNNYFEHKKVFEYLISQNFSEVYNLNFSPLSSVIISLFKPELQRGYKRINNQDIKDTWLEFAFRNMQNRKLAPLNLVDLWRLLAKNPLSPEKVNPQANPKGDSLGVVLAGRNSKRSLEMSELITCAHSIFAKNKYENIYLLGTRSEEKLAYEFLLQAPKALKEKTIDLCGKTTFKDLVEVVNSLGSLFSVDTGTIHLAAHLGIPVTAIFKASAYAYETGAYGLGHTVYQANIHCAPCLEFKACIYPNSINCHQSFSKPEFYKYLLTNKNQKPADIYHLTSDFDELGLIWHGYDDEFAIERKHIRDIYKEFLQIKNLTEHNSKQINNLFLEKDWVVSEAKPKDWWLEPIDQTKTAKKI